MSKHLINTKLLSKRLLSVVGVILVSGLFTSHMAEAFQIRQADSLRVMQSKPFAQSANFRVNADMLIQPSLTIRSADLVAQAAAPAPSSSPSVTPVVPSTTGGGGSGGGGGEKYSASDWLLSRKYDELVRDREERDGSFLTSAPENPDLNFDYIPTNPNDVELVGPGFEFPNNTEVEPSATQTPTVETPINSVSPSTKVVVRNPYVAPTTNQHNTATAEQLLITAPINTNNLMVVELSKSQKKELLESQSAGFNWPWSKGSRVKSEDWQQAAPQKALSTQTCIDCEDVLWWSWCSFIVMILLLILLLLIINTVLQIALFRFRVDKYIPDNPKSFIYRMKKFLKHIGLLSLALVSVSSLAQAQATTTPQLLIYEGELLDDSGAPSAGSFTFRFSFWDNGDYDATDVVGGVIDAAALDYRGWSEVQTTSTLSDGSFSLQMSDVTPFTAGLFDQDNLFLQVEVKNGGDPDTAYEFVDINLGDPTDDRKIIASVPFAFNANKLDYKELGFGAGNIPYLDIAGLLPNTVIPDLDLTASDLDLADITLSDFTNDLALNDGQVFIGDAANIANAVNISGDGTLDNTGVFTLALNSIGEDELDFGNVTLADFTNDVGFVTTDTLGDLACAANEIAKWSGAAWICAPDAGGAAFTASDGITLAGSNFTNDFGTSIETGEITDGTITGADLNFGDITLADFTNDAGLLTTVDVSDNTNLAAGTGLTLTDDTLSADLGTDIETAEIQDDAVTTDKIGTAGAGDADKVLTTDGAGNPLWEDKSTFGVSTLTSGSIFVGDGANVATGVVMSGDATIDNAGALSLVDDSIKDAEIDYAAVTLTDFTNDAGFLTTVDVSDNTNLAAGVGATLTGDSISVDLGTTIETGEITDGEITFADLNSVDITLSDFTNDAGFVTTDNDTTYTGSGGITLIGTDFTADLGTTIANAEIDDDAVTVAKIGTAGAVDADKILTTDGAGNPQWEDKSSFTTPALTSGNIFVGNGANDATGVVMSGDATIDNTGVFSLVDDSIKDAEIDYTTVTLSDFTNDAGFVTTDNDTTYNAGTGMNLVGTTFSTTLGTEIDSIEIANGSVSEIDLNFGDITLADFTNDAGFLTTVDISANTNLAAGAGLTLTGDSLSADLGADIVTGEIVDGTIADEDLNLADITLSDFTNDAGFVTTDNDTTYLAGIGLNLVGTTLSTTFGTSIDGIEIETNAVADDEIDYTNVTLNDFTNDAGFLTTVDISSNTNLAAGSGIMLVGDSIVANLGSDIVSGEIVDGTIGDSDLDLADITLADFTNDVGFLTSEIDGSTTNEIQDLNLVANTLSLSGDATTVDLTSYLDNTDEQDLTLVGDTLALTGDGTTVDLGAYLDNTDTTYSAGTGVTLVGTTFSADLGNSIDATEINTNAVGDDEINYTAVTLNDFTNDAGFLNAETQDITLLGSDLSITGGSTIDLSVIDTDTDTLNTLSCASGELAKWNGAAWACAPDDGGSSYTASDGVTLTGSNFTNDLGIAIDTGEIINGTIEAQDLNLVDITLTDFTNDAGFLTADTLDGLACAADQVARFNGVVWVCAGGPVSVTEVLSPRYPHSIFEDDGTNNTGSMFEEESILSSGILGTVIRWFSRQTILHDYDLVVQWTVPDDFDSFQAPGLNLDYKTSGLATDAVIDMTVQRNNDGIDELTATGVGLNSNGWANASLTLNAGTAWVAGDTMKIRLRMKAKDSNSAQTGNIKINYVRK